MLYRLESQYILLNIQCEAEKIVTRIQRCKRKEINGNKRVKLNNNDVISGL